MIAFLKIEKTKKMLTEEDHFILHLKTLQTMHQFWNKKKEPYNKATLPTSVSFFNWRHSDHTTLLEKKWNLSKIKPASITSSFFYETRQHLFEGGGRSKVTLKRQ
jgi:hypothetical protein